MGSDSLLHAAFNWEEKLLIFLLPPSGSYWACETSAQAQPSSAVSATSPHLKPANLNFFLSLNLPFHPPSVSFLWLCVCQSREKERWWFHYFFVRVIILCVSWHQFDIFESNEWLILPNRLFLICWWVNCFSLNSNQPNYRSLHSQLEELFCSVEQGNNIMYIKNKCWYFTLDIKSTKAFKKDENKPKQFKVAVRRIRRIMVSSVSPSWQPQMRGRRECDGLTTGFALLFPAAGQG